MRSCGVKLNLRPGRRQPCRFDAVVLAGQGDRLLFGACNGAKRSRCAEAALSDATILAQRLGILEPAWRSRRVAAHHCPSHRHRDAARDSVSAHGLEPEHLRRTGEARWPRRAGPVAGLSGACGRKRRVLDARGLRAHDHGAALARVDERPRGRSLARQRPLLSTQSRRRRGPQEPRIPHRRRLAAITFVVVLWTIGGALSFDLAGASITIPGFLVVAAVLYAFIASGSSKPCREARSSAWRLPDCSFTARISSCSTRRPPRSTRPARKH